MPGLLGVAAFYVAVQYLKMHPGRNVEDWTSVLMFPDTLRSYLAKFADNTD